MPGSFNHAQLHAADTQLVAFFHCPMRKCCAGFFAENDFRPGSFGQLAMAAHKVSMQVCFDDVLNLQTLRRRFIDVLIDIALRIDDGGFTVRANQVRRVRQTAEIELFEIHGISGRALKSPHPLNAFTNTATRSCMSKSNYRTDGSYGSYQSHLSHKFTRTRESHFHFSPGRYLETACASTSAFVKATFFSCPFANISA